MEEMRSRQSEEQDKRRALSAALAGNGCGCFVADLTRLTMPQCAGARRPTFYQQCRSRAPRIPYDAHKTRTSIPTACASWSDAQVLPAGIHPLPHVVAHHDRRTPFAAGLARQLVGGVYAHLAAKPADRRGEVQVIDGRVVNQCGIAQRIDARGDGPD